MANICNIKSNECLNRAADIIKNGGVVVYPTDTLYGFGVDATNDRAVNRLAQLKERGGPWSIVVADFKMLELYCDISKNIKEFITSNIPGKVTLILTVKDSSLSRDILSEEGTVGIRIPEHPFPIKLVKELGYPITTTSVNRTGEVPLNDPHKIAQEFGEMIDMIVDDGPLTLSTGSRIYDVSSDEIKILRN